MSPKQITCARCRKPVESTSWWDDHTTRERVLQVRCHGAVDEMRFRPDRLSLEQLRAPELKGPERAGRWALRSNLVLGLGPEA